MSKNLRADNRMPLVALVSLLAAALLLPLLAAGCGPSTPEKAVRNFLEAIETNNWNLFLSSILPDEVRKMTDEDVTYWRDQALPGASDSVLFAPDQLQMMSRPEGEDRAKVRITGGKIVLVQAGVDSDITLNMKDRTFITKDPETGQMITEEFGEQEEAIARDLAEYEVVKYKGGWYVDFKLAQIIEEPLMEEPPTMEDLEEMDLEEMDIEEMELEEPQAE